MPSSKFSDVARAQSILLVDDNKMGLSARKTVLEELGYRIITAACAEDGLEAFARQSCDLVITDYRMPRMNGIELIAKVRTHKPLVPVVLISGFVDSLGLNEMNTGADVVIQKSANEVSHLVRAVNRLLRRRPEKKPAASQQRAGSALKARRKGV